MEKNCCRRTHDSLNCAVTCKDDLELFLSQISRDAHVKLISTLVIKELCTQKDTGRRNER